MNNLTELLEPPFVDPCVDQAETRWLITTGEPALREFNSRAAWELAQRKYVPGKSIRFRKLARFATETGWSVLEEVVMTALDQAPLKGDTCILCGGKVNARGLNLGAFALHRSCKVGFVNPDVVESLILET